MHHLGLNIYSLRASEMHCELFAGKNLGVAFQTDGAPSGHVSHEKLVNTFPPIQAGEGVAQSASEVGLCRHGCRFGSGGQPHALSRCRRVVGDGGWPPAQAVVGVARICCPLLAGCLRCPGCSYGFILWCLLIGLSPLLLCLLLLIGLLSPLGDGVAPSSHRGAEVVDREDALEHLFAATVEFGPVFRIPGNIAKKLAVLEQLDSDGSRLLPANS